MVRCSSLSKINCTGGTHNYGGELYNYEGEGMYCVGCKYCDMNISLMTLLFFQ